MSSENRMHQDPAAFDTRFDSDLLHPRHWPTWLMLALMCLFAWVPTRWRDALARKLAPLAVRLAKKPCRVARTNLAICFPALSVEQREALLLANMTKGLQCMLAFGVPTFRSRRTLLSRYRVTGWEHVQAAEASGKPIIFLMPHAWAVDMAGLYISAQGLKMCTMMHSVPNKLYDWFINRQRRFFGGTVYERSAGLKPIIRNLKQGYHFFYLPDQDHGPEGSLFVPFFGRMKATLPALPKLCKLTQAVVVPMFIAYDDHLGGYQIEFSPALSDYPGQDIATDTLRMNQIIEQQVARFSADYMWFLKYFRSRPADDPGRTYD